MADLIDRSMAIDFKVSHGIHEDCEFYVPYGEVKQYLEQLPTAERKGHWVKKWHKVFKEELPCCSECNNFMAFTFDYCPSCGARMEREL